MAGRDCAARLSNGVQHMKLSVICPALSDEDAAIWRDRVGVRNAFDLLYQRMAWREWKAVEKRYV